MEVDGVYGHKIDDLHDFVLTEAAGGQEKHELVELFGILGQMLLDSGLEVLPEVAQEAFDLHIALADLQRQSALPEDVGSLVVGLHLLNELEHLGVGQPPGILIHSAKRKGQFGARRGVWK